MQKEYLIYYGSILLAAFFAWLAQKFAKDKKGKFKLNKFFWILSIAVLTIVIGLRKSGVGVDDWQYEQIYNRVRVSWTYCRIFARNNGTWILNIKLYCWHIYIQLSSIFIYCIFNIYFILL